MSPLLLLPPSAERTPAGEPGEPGGDWVIPRSITLLVYDPVAPDICPRPSSARGKPTFGGGPARGPARLCVLAACACSCSQFGGTLTVGMAFSRCSSRTLLCSSIASLTVM